jgi:hypothetical protein
MYSVITAALLNPTEQKVILHILQYWQSHLDTAATLWCHHYIALTHNRRAAGATDRDSQHSDSRACVDWAGPHVAAAPFKVAAHSTPHHNTTPHHTTPHHTFTRTTTPVYQATLPSYLINSAHGGCNVHRNAAMTASTQHTVKSCKVQLHPGYLFHCIMHYLLASMKWRHNKEDLSASLTVLSPQ